MQFKLDLSGLKRLQSNAQALSRPRRVRLIDLFDSAFMRNNTNYLSFEQMLSDSDIRDFDAASDLDKDNMVRRLTRFTNWEAFLNAAGAEYAKKQIFE